MEIFGSWTHHGERVACCVYDLSWPLAAARDFLWLDLALKATHPPDPRSDRSAEGYSGGGDPASTHLLPTNESTPTNPPTQPPTLPPQ